MEAGEYGEAEAVLQRAISLTPGDYKFPRNKKKKGSKVKW